MKTSVLTLLCFCVLLAAVLYVSADETNDVDAVDDDFGTLPSRDKRRVGMRRPGRRRRPNRGGDNVDGDEEDENAMEPGRRRRPGRRNRPGRGRRPGRPGAAGRPGRPGRRGRQRPVVDENSLGQRAQRLISTLASSQNSFSTALHREIGSSAENVIYSPYSIHQALAMTYMGARGRTAFQMKRTLSLQGLGRRVHRANKVLNSISNNAENVTLKVANAVYAKPGINILESFQNGLRMNYDSSITLFDMEHPNGPEAPINEWVSTQTNALIPTLLSPGTITQMTAMVLVNAIYFKAAWNSTFNELLTRQEMFNKNTLEQVPVQMMQVEEKFKTGVLPGHAARVLELPYQGGRYSMLVILPDETEGLSTLEETLTAENLAVNLDTVVPAKVKVFLPRFKLETSTSLKPSLQNMGMVRPFSTGQADFSGIDGDNDLYISDVIHRAVVEVNEEGSEAAGATAVIIGLRSMMHQPVPEFRCDRPFLFLIRDTVSKVNLFIGKFSGGA